MGEHSLITEDDAKTKWCPLARTTDLGNRPVTVNRQDNSPDPDCMCIASACMAWRRAAPKPERGETDADFAARRDRILAARQGFCGAFGKPS